MSSVAVSRTPSDDDKTMTILEHLQEFRNRMIICAVAIGLGMVAALFFLTNQVIRLLKAPAEDKVENFELIFTQPLEYWSVYFLVTLYAGVVIAMPVLVWQFFGFVGPGLTREEKRWGYPVVFGATAMFLLGVAFAYYIEMPPALNFLLDSNDNAAPFISIKYYISFALKMLLVTGLVFEAPLLVMGLAKVGIVTSRKIFGWWRYIIVGSVIIAAIITPSPDPVTCLIVAVPMMFLFFLGGILAKLVEKNPIIPRA